MTNAGDIRLKFNLLFWYGILFFSLLILAALLAVSQWFVALALAGVLAMATVPYHAKLAVYLSLTTFQAAFVLPFMPGRPYVWETAALLGWSGVLILLLLRRYPTDVPQVIRRNRLVFLGVLIYSVTLFVIMRVHGIGFRIFGSAQMGGRYYFQQLICAIFPLLFILTNMEEKTFLRLMYLQYAFSLTYLISGFALVDSGGGGGIRNLVLSFFALSADAVNFLFKSEHFGIRRLQSFQWAGIGLLSILLVRFSLKEYFSRKSLWLLPLFLGIFGVSLLSGHRSIVVWLGANLLILGYVQRFYSVKTISVTMATMLVSLAFLYSFVDRTPLAVQRAVSFLPGIRVASEAKLDAEGTLHDREVLRQIGWQMIPQYLWLGRGYDLATDLGQFPIYGVQANVDQGRFFNGFIGSMVDTGIPGTFGLLLFMIGGTTCAVRLIRYLRQHGCVDDLSRVGALLASTWIFSVLFFLFLHGDSSSALKNFALQTGTMILCQRLLDRRLLARETQQADESEPASVPERSVTEPAYA